MGAYNWIVILLCLGMVGLLYACTYDVVETLHDSAYNSTPDAQKGVSIIWMAWKYLPIACIVSISVYAYMSGQK